MNPSLLSFPGLLLLVLSPLPQIATPSPESLHTRGLAILATANPDFRYTKALQQGFEPARAPLEALRTTNVLSQAEAEALLEIKMVRVDPPLARAARINSVVQVEVFVDAQGRVRSARIFGGGHALLNDAAIETVNALRYKPHNVNGQPAPFTTIVSVNYDF